MTSERLNWNQVKNGERLQHQLQLQSQHIDRVFSKHRLPAQVSGGRLDAQGIRFDLVSQLEWGWQRIRQLKAELLAVLGVNDARLTPTPGGAGLFVKKQADPPVALFDLLPLLPELPPLTAVLGMEEDGHPLLVQLGGGDVDHLLLCGGAGAGKSVLLRTMILSLAMNTGQPDCQLLVVDPPLPARPHSKQLTPAAYLPHMLASPAREMDEILELFGFLNGELAFRLEQGHQTPAIVVAVEEVTSLMGIGGEAIAAPLRRLLADGAAAGIHLLLTTRQSRALLMDPVFRNNIPLWIFGAASEGEESGDPGTADLLGGGDFLAVVDGRRTRFQAAYIGRYDSHLVLSKLRRHRPQPLLAFPFREAPEEEIAVPPPREEPVAILDEDAEVVQQDDVLRPASKMQDERRQRVPKAQIN